VRPPSWLRVGRLRREGNHAVVDVEIRERIFILAASGEQADIFRRRWQAEMPDSRRLQDAIYLHGNTAGLMGHVILPSDRLVGLEGYYRHPQADRIDTWLRRTLAKTGRSFEIEPATT
jgi:hypothetical protein